LKTSSIKTILVKSSLLALALQFLSLIGFFQLNLGIIKVVSSVTSGRSLTIDLGIASGLRMPLEGLLVTSKLS